MKDHIIEIMKGNTPLYLAAIDKDFWRCRWTADINNSLLLKQSEAMDFSVFAWKSEVDVKIVRLKVCAAR